MATYCITRSRKDAFDVVADGYGQVFSYNNEPAAEFKARRLREAYPNAKFEVAPTDGAPKTVWRTY